MKQIIDFTNEIIEIYFIKKDLNALKTKLDDNINAFDKEYHEFYRTIEELKTLSDAASKDYPNNFKINNIKYNPIEVADTIVMILGDFDIDIKGSNNMQIPMRFTMICKVYNDQIKLMHCDSSIVYTNLQDGFDRTKYNLTQNIFNDTYEESFRVFESLANTLDGAIIKISADNDLKVYYRNNGFYDLIGYNSKEFEQRFENDLSNIIYEQDLYYVLYAITDQSNGNEISLEFRIKNKKGELVWVLLKAHNFGSDKDSYLCVMLDISQNKNVRLDLELKAQLDPLTKIYNKCEAKILIQNYIIGKGVGNKHAFMIVDIDNFKEINDNLGHLFGDTIIIEAANVLKKTVAKTDIIGRIGGDEFIVFIKDISLVDDVLIQAKQICNGFKDIYIGENEYSNISCSIGISIYPTDGTFYNELFEKADLALYNVKNNCKNNCFLYNESLKFEKSKKKYKEIKNNYLYKSSLENYIFEIMADTKDVNSAIMLILDRIGKRFDISHISILETSADDCWVKVTYEWCNEGIKSSKNKMPPIERSNCSDYLELFKEQSIFCCEDIDAPQTPIIIKKIAELIGLKSTLQCVILDSGNFRGCVCFDNNIEKHKWSTKEREILIYITKIMSSYLLKMRTKEQLEKEKFMTKAIELNQSMYSYILKPNTYELIYISTNVNISGNNVQVGDVCYKAIANKDAPCDYCPIKGLDKKNKSNTVEVYMDQSNIWASFTASYINLEDGQRTILICCSNVTNFIKRITSKDTLTGLSSLSQFQVDVTEKLNKNRRDKYALIYSDFNKFKYINGTAGYALGNNVLIEFAKLISSMTKKDELVCRAAADKFLMLLKYRQLDDLIERSKAFNQKIEQLKNLKFRNVQISVISGIYLIQSYDKDVTYMIDKANTARKIIKGSHKNSFNFYDEQLHQRVMKEKRIESLMTSALENKEFLIYLQPKVQLKNKNIAGAEALVRWKGTDNKIISPMEFIPIFEKNGFIIELDFYIYEQVFKVIRKWLDNQQTVVPISVNVSRAHINDSEFIPRLEHLVKKYNMPIDLIELELTESIFLENTEHLFNTINTLKELGFTISIDDFGSGYSSLNLLKDISVDVIKLDKEFFSHDSMDRKDKVVASNIIRMVKELNLKVLSEGVETKEQADFLAEVGCDLAQGYLFAKPMPIEDFEKLLFMNGI